MLALYVPVPLLTILGGGFLLVPTVALLVAAAKAPPPPDDWSMPSWVVRVLVATVGAFGLLLAFLAVTR